MDSASADRDRDAGALHESVRNAATGIVAGSGSLPFAVADRLIAQGRRAVLFGIRGFCDPQRIAAYPHHWVALGQLGRLIRLLRREHCREVIFIGGLVRPALSELRLDLGTLLAIPKIFAAYRGGDDRLLTGVGRLVEGYGLRVVGIREAAPDLMMPQGALTRAAPDAQAQADIAKGVALLRAMSPFDVGQGVVVIDGHAVCIEDIEGTDEMLARAARLRANGRLRAPPGRGVLVKMPKDGQNLALDLPTIGPKTIAGIQAAGLAGLAAASGQALLAEPQAAIAAADAAGLFVVGLPA